MLRQASENVVCGDEYARLTPHVRRKRKPFGCTTYGEDDEEVLCDVFPFRLGLRMEAKTETDAGGERCTTASSLSAAPRKDGRALRVSVGGVHRKGLYGSVDGKRIARGER